MVKAPSGKYRLGDPATNPSVWNGDLIHDVEMSLGNGENTQYVLGPYSIFWKDVEKAGQEDRVSR